MTWKSVLAGTAAVTAAVLLAAEAPKLPPPFATRSVNNGPKVIEKPGDAELKLPAGFRVGIFAEGFDKPRYMLQGFAGEILLSDAAADNKGAVYALKGAERKKLIANLDRPYGLALWKDYLYVGEPTSIKRYKYDGNSLTAGPGEEVVSLAGFGKGHWTRSLLFDKDGKKLYVGTGSGSNVAPGEDPRRAAINHYNPDGSGHDILAAGTRNPIGIHWYPGTETLWAAVQERDELGDDLVPDYLTSIKPGAFYGWPYAYTGPNEDPRNKGLKPDLVARTIAGDVQLGAHVAVLDFLFYTGKQFPAEYQGGAFLALHGSWNRSQRVGQSIAFIPFKNAKPAGEMRQFLTGWMLAPDKREVWGRPVALMQMTDGSLLVSDDGGNKIWHISYKRP